MMNRPCCLTIAGSDSGGNAGVQADLRAFHCYGMHGCTVFAALTAQNPFGVSAIHDVPADFVRAQLDAVLGVYDIRALKTGMLSSAVIVETVADCLRNYPDIQKVIDPVMIATSGAKLISDEAISALKQSLLPLATVITPNLPEASVLAEMEIRNRSDLHTAAQRLYDRFGCAVLIKGGHAQADLEEAEDTLLADGVFSTYKLPWIDHPVSTHGTGCSMAASLAAELALDHSLQDAVNGAKDYVYQAIRDSYYVGENCGVLGFVDRKP